MKITTTLRLMVLTLIACSVAPSIHADVIYNNFGPGNAYNNTSGYSVGGNFSVAARFTAPDDLQLTLVELGMHSFASNFTADISIAPDAGGSPGALTLLGTTGILPMTGNNTNPISSVSGDNYSLASGANYWIVATAASNNAVWNYNTTSTATPVKTRSGSDPWLVGGTTPAMRLSAVIPEPASILLAAAAMLLPVASRVRRTRTQSIS